jgi:Uncharacterized iron-regulated protein
MNKLFKNMILALALIMLGFNFYSCDDTNSDDNDEEYEALYRQILTNYVDKTIIPTYKNMAEAALEMRAANEALKANPSDATMKAASDAWMKARIWWELSEAFLFGPVSEDAFNVDAHIDSWPLELEDIKAAIIEENGDVTGQEAWNKEEGVIGFHTAEYLLYRDGKSRPISELSEAELKYLTAVTDALVWDCMLVYVAWAGENNVSAQIKAVFNENEDVVDFYNSRPNFKNFGDKMKLEASFYSSLEAAVTEISEGAKTIAEEVGATKIDAPYADKKIEEVESWYSWHSLDDYTNNIKSIKNAYLGGTDDSSRTSVCLSSYVALVNPTLDNQVKNKIEECMTKIAAIGNGGKSFYEVVRDQINKAEVDAAVDACLELRDLFGRVTDSVQ